MGKLGVAVKFHSCTASLVGHGLKHNDIFNLMSAQNRDHCYVPYCLLRKELSKSGIEINTVDLNTRKNVAFELHMDVQKNVGDIPKYVMLLESPVIRPDNLRNDMLAKYNIVFTWNDDLVDGQRYIKINHPNKIIVNDSRGWHGRNRLCCMIAGNKSVRHASPLELYSERVKTIRWFEQNAPQDFDLFGTGWDVPAARRGLMGKALGRVQRQLFSRIGNVYFPSYRGKVVSKLETFQKYRFSICYENVRDISGYITEKIFDSFFAGCVPVYWGASNISTHIPDTCFIDRRKFANHEDLYHFMLAMTESEYIAYQERIAAFLTSEQVRPFSAEFFAKTICDTIVRDLGIAA